MRWLIREWRGGELSLLAVALVVAVAIVSGITAFTDRLHRGIESESHRFLAADRVLISPVPVKETWLDFAEAMGLQTAKAVSFQSMVFAGDEGMQLASVKAVTENYPLRGELRVADKPFGIEYLVKETPRAGEVWADSRLFPLLDVEIGAALGLGEIELPVSRVITGEPDRGRFAGVGPRLMMNIADLPRSEIVQVGSVVEYRYLFAGEPAVLNEFGAWLNPRLETRHRWQDLQNSEPTVAKALQRAERFLLLAGSFGVALAGVAVALAARRYAERHFDSVAIMKAIGAPAGQIMRLYTINLILLAVIATAIGCALGWGVQQGLLYLLQDLMGFDAPPPGIRPVLVGAVTAGICLLTFALPPIIQLRLISPLRVLRRDFDAAGPALWQSVSLGLLGIYLLMLWYTQSLMLSSAVLLAVLLMLLIAGLFVVKLLVLLGRFRRPVNTPLGLAMTALNRRSGANAFQVVSFGLAFMVITALILVRSSLLEEWQLQIPENTPNHFLMNVADHDVTRLEQFFESRNIEAAGMFPMVRGRLLTVNGVELRDIESLDAQDGSLNREMNLSWAQELPSDNELLEGEWFTDRVNGEPVGGISLEQGFAEEHNFGIGDRLGFDIGSLILEAPVTSIRVLDWNSMRPNFFMLLPRSTLEPYPKTFITSFYLPLAEKPVLNELVRGFPTVVLIEVDAVIKQVRSIIGQVSSAVELVLFLVVLCALLVTIANVQASLDTRLHENAILRSFGASRRLIARGLVFEFATIGVLAGGLAVLGAELAVWIVQVELLGLSGSFHPWIWLAVPVIAGLLIGFSGYWACRRVVQSPPMGVLREI